VARAIVTAGAKVQKWTGNGYVAVNAFSINDYYYPGDWRRGYGLGNSTCFYNTSLPLYQPDWCCGWMGLGCDGNYLLDSLDVSAISWTKTSHIPTAIGALTNLRFLRLSSMGLTGPIPNFAGLSRLTRLSLDGNRLTGAVPAFVYTVFTANRNRNLNLQINCNLTSPVATVAGQLYNQGLCGSGTTGTGPAALPPG
jgi:hypothetical protein